MLLKRNALPATMRLLSFDIANKSLAHCCIDVNTAWRQEAMNSQTLEEANVAVDSAVKWVSGGVHDLIPNKKLKDSTAHERTLGLKRVMTSLRQLKTEDTIVLVEYQMSANYNANAIYNQIMYEMTDETTQVVVMRPTMKNTVQLSDDLGYRHFVGKYASKYTANKAHTTANLLCYDRVFGTDNSLSTVKKKNVDDLADAFMQALAFAWSKSFLQP